MISLNLIDSSITKGISTDYFVRYKTKGKSEFYWKDLFYKIFLGNNEKLSKNEWELHKWLVREGVNTANIVKAILRDNFEKLQKISS